MIARPVPLWRRNLVGGVVIAAALAVSTATDLWPAWSSYRDTVRPHTVVPAGRSASADGQTWSIADVRHLGRRTGFGSRTLPDGTVLIAVTVDRSGRAPANQWCVGVLTDGDLRWRGESPATYGVPDTGGAGSNCARPGPQKWVFVVPDDAVPDAVDVTAPGGVILVRLQL